MVLSGRTAYQAVLNFRVENAEKVPTVFGRIDASLARSNNQLAELNARLDEYNRASQQLQPVVKQYEMLNREIDRTSRSIATLEQRTARANERLDNVGRSALFNVNSEIRGIQRQLGALGNVNPTIISAAQQKRVAELPDEIAKARMELERLNAEYTAQNEALEQRFNPLGDRSRELRQQIADARSEERRLRASGGDADDIRAIRTRLAELEAEQGQVISQGIFDQERSRIEQQVGRPRSRVRERIDELESEQRALSGLGTTMSNDERIARGLREELNRLQMEQSELQSSLGPERVARINDEFEERILSARYAELTNDINRQQAALQDLQRARRAATRPSEQASLDHRIETTRQGLRPQLEAQQELGGQISRARSELRGTRNARREVNRLTESINEAKESINELEMAQVEFNQEASKLNPAVRDYERLQERIQDTRIEIRKTSQEQEELNNRWVRQRQLTRTLGRGALALGATSLIGTIGLGYLIEQRGAEATQISSVGRSLGLSYELYQQARNLARYGGGYTLDTDEFQEIGIRISEARTGHGEAYEAFLRAGYDPLDLEPADFISFIRSTRELPEGVRAGVLEGALGDTLSEKFGIPVAGLSEEEFRRALELPILSDEDVEQLREARFELGRMQVSMERLAIHVASAFVPALTALTDVVEPLALGFSEIAKGNQEWLLIIGGVLAGLAVVTAATWALNQALAVRAALSPGAGWAALGLAAGVIGAGAILGLSAHRIGGNVRNELEGSFSELEFSVGEGARKGVSEGGKDQLGALENILCPPGTDPVSDTIDPTGGVDGEEMVPRFGQVHRSNQPTPNEAAAEFWSGTIDFITAGALTNVPPAVNYVQNDLYDDYDNFVRNYINPALTFDLTDLSSGPLDYIRNDLYDDYDNFVRDYVNPAITFDLTDLFSGSESFEQSAPPISSRLDDNPDELRVVFDTSGIDKEETKEIVMDTLQRTFSGQLP